MDNSKRRRHSYCHGQLRQSNSTIIKFCQLIARILWSPTLPDLLYNAQVKKTVIIIITIETHAQSISELEANLLPGMATKTALAALKKKRIS